MNSRRLTPEILDSLPPSDPAALASRRDLQRIHPFLGQHRLWIEWLRKTYPSAPPRSLADLGCGDAHLLAQILPLAFPGGGNGCHLLLVDRQPCVSSAILAQFRQAHWQPSVLSATAFSWAQSTTAVDLVLTNLFLHHFEDAPLEKLLREISRIAHRFAAAEPRRNLAGTIGSHLLRLLGCHPVTLHDARVSVAAGFRAKELSQLWPSSTTWSLQEKQTGPFTHFFSAERKD